MYELAAHLMVSTGSVGAQSNLKLETETRSITNLAPFNQEQGDGFCCLVMRCNGPSSAFCLMFLQKPTDVLNL